MLFCKGDMHADLSINDLSFSKFPEGRDLTKNDFVIIAGDFGLGFITEYHLKWLRDRPFTVLVVRGNHDSTDIIRSLPEIDMFGSKVKVIYDGVYLLQDGHVYTIDGRTIFVMGGALSIDRDQRKEGKNWWADEQPSYKEFYLGRENLEKIDWKVDYVVTHTCPTNVIEALYEKFKIGSLLSTDPKYNDFTCKMLDYFQDKLYIKGSWLFGHFHEDTYLMDGKYICTYHKVQKLI